MNVIVTGVTGQDGSLMVDYLLKNTEFIIYGVVRRVSNPNYSNLKTSIDNPRFKIISGDLGDSHSINNIVQQYNPSYFINLAAQSHVHESWRVPEQTFDIDATGVLRILEAIRKYAPECRFYNAGSSEEFGDVVKVPQDETHPLRPRSPYGAAKAAARHITKVYRESYDLYAIQGALFNHESERRGDTFVTRRITKNIASIKKKIDNNINYEPLALGNLDSRRDWSHAYDFVDGIWKMLNQDVYNKELSEKLDKQFPVNSPNEVWPSFAVNKWLSKNIKEYVLSSNETHAVREFVELTVGKAFSGCRFYWSGAGTNEHLILDYKGKEYILITIDSNLFRPAEVDLLLGDSTKARQELNWLPKISFNQLVDRMITNDLKN